MGALPEPSLERATAYPEDQRTLADEDNERQKLPGGCSSPAEPGGRLSPAQADRAADEPRNDCRPSPSRGYE